MGKDKSRHDMLVGEPFITTPEYSEHCRKVVKYWNEHKHGNPCRMYNVGCMIEYMDYTPRTLEEIIKN